MTRLVAILAFALSASCNESKSQSRVSPSAAVTTGQRNNENEWKLEGEHGDCVVQLGVKRTEVHKRCGRPFETGMQPMVRNRDRSNPAFLECSAPCDRYGNETLFYGCDSSIETVGKPAKDGTCVDIALGRESPAALHDIPVKP
jgi:hypothetical protein